MGGEDDITIQTVTWPDLELPLPRNITEGEVRGNVILTAKPIFDLSPTISEPEEALTVIPDVRATAFPEAEERTEGVTRPWGFPEESTRGLDSATAFTSEDLVVQVTLGPGAAEVPGQPHLPGGKYTPGGQAGQLSPLFDHKALTPNEVTWGNQGVYQTDDSATQLKTNQTHLNTTALDDPMALPGLVLPTRIKNQQSLVSRLNTAVLR